MAKKRNLTEVKGGEGFSLEEGDSIEGYLEGINEGKFGPVYEIKDEETEEIKSIFSKTILASKMSKIPIGCFVRIERLKDRKTGNGKIAQDFRVLFDEKEAEKLKEDSS